MKTVGIIGAGAAGLCALKHVLSKEGLTPLIWEQSKELGGTWIYTPKTGRDENGNLIHSSMYESLITNLPKEIMAFPDFPFKEDENSFLHHTKVLEYLNGYADHFGLKPWIKFSHTVEGVEPIDQDDRFTRWRITVKDLIKGTSQTIELDNLIVCNGHYFTPRFPDIENIELFEGMQLHSHNYRTPEAFSDAKIVVLGAKGSGLDISLEIAKVAQVVNLAHNLPVPVPSKLPPNLHQVKGVVTAKKDGFVLSDKTFIEADAIVYCTGYEYTFPFLSPSCGIHVEENQVQTLYKHIVNTKFPSMGFIGIPFMICPFPLFDIQIRYMLNAFCGEMVLPSRECMENNQREELQRKVEQGHPARYYHKLGDSQWGYADNLAEEGNLNRLPSVIGKIYHDCHLVRRLSLVSYKTNKYQLIDSESFISSFGKVDPNMTIPGTQYIIEVFERGIEVPCLDIVREEMRLSRVPKRHFHLLGSNQWSYMDDLLSSMNFKAFPKFYQKIHDIVWYRRLLFLPVYKNFVYSFKMKNDDIEVVEMLDGVVRNTSFDLITYGAKQLFYLGVIYMPYVMMRKVFVYWIE